MILVLKLICCFFVCVVVPLAVVAFLDARDKFRAKPPEAR